jgi:hypothetical protein
LFDALSVNISHYASLLWFALGWLTFWMVGHHFRTPCSLDITLHFLMGHAFK